MFVPLSKIKLRLAFRGTTEQGANTRGQNSVVEAKEPKSNPHHDRSRREERDLPPRGFGLPEYLIIVGQETPNAQKLQLGRGN